MLTYEILVASPRMFLCFTGITVTEFMHLLLAFDLAWQFYAVDQLLASYPRQRQPGGGRKATLVRVEEKLLFILIYLKL